MATAEQVKALLRSFADKDDTRFCRIALQVAAHEAKLGHTNLARELRDLVKAAQKRGKSEKRTLKALRLSSVKPELEGLLTVASPDFKLGDMILFDPIEGALSRLLREYRQQGKLARHGLEPRRKVLFYGPPGTGKTMSASSVAGELGLPLFTVRFEGMITKFLGETAAKLRLIFDAMYDVRGVYFFDEFDAIGARRALPNDTGEIRRVLNCFLQFLEADESRSVILAATNSLEMLDQALFRRFDDVIEFHLPDSELVTKTLQRYLADFVAKDIDWKAVQSAAGNLSFADLARASQDAAKDMVLDDRPALATSDIVFALEQRKSSRPSLMEHQ